MAIQFDKYFLGGGGWEVSLAGPRELETSGSRQSTRECVGSHYIDYNFKSGDGVLGVSSDSQAPEEYSTRNRPQ
jgi:hypothetical protein